MTVVAVACCGAVASWGAVAGAASGQRRQTPLQAGLSFYQGKAITFIVPSSVGGGGDTIARLLGPIIASYLHASVSVENIPAGNTIPGQNVLAASTPNGLTVGELHDQTDVLNLVTGTPGLNFDPAALPLLGGTKLGASFFLASPSSSYTTITSVKDAPTPPAFLTTGGGTLLETAVIMGVLGIHVRYISGYSSTGPLLTGFLRGDGPLTFGTLAQFLSTIVAGQARPILEFGPTSFPPAEQSNFSKVQTLNQYLAKHPLKTKAQLKALNAMLATGILEEEFAAPRKTPTPQLTALKAAFQTAVTSQQFHAYQLNQGDKLGYVSPTATRDYLVGAIAGAKAMTPYYDAATGT